jgi:hypothetical protein
MNVYIATKFENTEGFNKLRSLLVRNGHTISHDWTKESPDGYSGPALYAHLQKCAIADIDAVKLSDALVFIPVPDKPMVGAYVELGAALAGGLFGKRVIVVDAFNPNHQRNIFWHLPEIEHVRTIEEAADVLGRLFETTE